MRQWHFVFSCLLVVVEHAERNAESGSRAVREHLGSAVAEEPTGGAVDGAGAVSLRLTGSREWVGRRWDDLV